jgi:uncharacterized membrane protein YfcA
LLNYLLLCFTAFAAGAQNSLAGGGTLYTFPSLLGVLHNSVLANGTSTVALLPGSFAGAWGFRREVAQTPRRTLLLLMGPSLAGGILGTLLVVNFPENYFKMMVPWLILLAALLFLFQPLIAKATGAKPVAHRPSLLVRIGVILFQLLVAIYGGYFGAGIGILMLSSLSLMGLGDVHRVNALKTVLACGINAMSVVIFVCYRLVRWEYAVPMAVTAIIGGYLGARVSRRLNKTLLRWLVIAIGFGLAAYYFADQWGLLGQ